MLAFFNGIKIKSGRAAEYMLYALVFFLPFQTRLILKPGNLNGGYFEYNSYSLYFTDIILLILFIFFLLSFSDGKRLNGAGSQKPGAANSSSLSGLPFRSSREQSLNEGGEPKKIFHDNRFKLFGGIIALFLLSALISVFSAPDKAYAAYGFLRLVAGLVVFSAVIGLNCDKLRLASCFIAGMLIQALFAVWQFFSQSAFAFKWLGMAAHDPSAPGTSVVESVFGRLFRAYGGLDHPNILGAASAVALLLVIDLYFRSPARTDSKLSIRKLQFSANENFWLFTAYCLLLASLFFTFSRSAWLALASGLFAYVLLSIRQIKPAFAKRLFLAFLASLAVLAPLGFAFRGELLARVQSQGRLENKSIEERTALNSQAIELIKAHPLTGVGVGNFSLAVHLRINPGRPAYAYQPVHNSFLLIFAEQGIVGAASIILLLAAACHLLLSQAFFSGSVGKTSNQSFFEITGSAALIVILIILMLFDHWLFSLHYGILLFWFIIGMVIAQAFAVFNYSDNHAGR